MVDKGEIGREMNPSRRRFLRIAGTASIGTYSYAGAVYGKGPDELPSEDKLRETLEKRYGKAPANVTINVLRNYYHKKEKGVMSARTFHDTVTKELLKHPNGRVVAEDVTRTDQELQDSSLMYGRDTIKAGGTENLDTQMSASQGTVGTTSSSEDLLLTLWEADKNTSGGGSAHADVEFYYAGGGLYVCDKQKVEAGAFIYGSSWAYVRFYYTYTPDTTGDYKLTIDYYRNGKAVSGAAEMSLYARDSSGSLNNKVVESVNTDVSGNTSRYKTFTLEGGKTYDLGFQTRCTASTGGGGSFGDFYENSRHVDPPSITVEKVN